MKRITVLAACLLLPLAAARGDETGRYAYAWPLTLSGDSAAWQIELPVEVYRALGDAQLRDLVVVDEQGNAVPTALRAGEPAAGVETRSELPLFALPTGTPAAEGPLNLRIERDANGRLRSLDADLGTSGAKASAGTQDYLLDAGALTAPIERLHLDWNDSADAVSAQFALSASDDLQNWRVVVANANVLGLARDGHRLDHRDIELAGLRTKYLRLRRLDAGAALPGLRVAAIIASAAGPLRAARQWLTLTAERDASAPSADGAAEYRFLAPAALPVEAIRLDLAGDISIARTRVASRRNDAGAWQPRADFTAFRLRQGDAPIASDDVALAQVARDAQWRVQTATPLASPPQLNLAWRPDRFVFLGDAKQHYRLVAGSATARRADYPVDVALARLCAELGAGWQPPLAALGARETLAGDAALQAPTPSSKYDWKAFLLWGVLVAAAAAIGYLALSLLRGQKSP